MTIKYSICITNYNNRGTISECINSILNQIDSRFEIVVVDNMSNDGSEIILSEMAKLGLINLVRRKCSRGKGRQIAFENSVGEYIVAQMDTDEEFNPVLQEFLNLYHSLCDGDLLVAADLVAAGGQRSWRQNITVGPRSLIAELGGWRDLQHAEDWDLWRRAAQRQHYKWTIYPIVRDEKSVKKKLGAIQSFKQQVVRYRDVLRLGRNLFNTGETVTYRQRLAEICARLIVPLYDSYADDFNIQFDSGDPRYFIKLK
jgi:glycosyltransferase involved in cell wall biosynthesis